MGDPVNFGQVAHLRFGLRAAKMGAAPVRNRKLERFGGELIQAGAHGVRHCLRRVVEVAVKIGEDFVSDFE